jgi:hypothetical protein
MKTPVLLIAFNRPDITSQAVGAIALARPGKLYVAADGPRPGNDGDVANCAETRRVATQVTWPCNVKTLFQESNLGCKKGVATAISWFFENEEEGIIIEDDILPDPTFFPFCEELLERYRTDSRVSLISGSNFVSDKIRTRCSYHFSIYGYIWGWASWRRAWTDFDMAIREWPSWRETDALRRVASQGRPFQHFWRAAFDTAYRGEVDTWDYQWLFANWRLGRLAVLPCVNLTRNIGFRADATHTGAKEPAYVRLSSALPMAFPLTHPPQVEPTPLLDSLISRTVYGISPWRYWLTQVGPIAILRRAVRPIVRCLSGKQRKVP